MNRRTFIKTATAGGAFLPVFAKLDAPAQSGEADVNVAVIGFGSAGQALAAGMIRMTGVRVRCVCDIWKFQRQRAVAFFKSYGYGVEVYEDYREMLDKEERNIDAVIVATPDWMHGEQVCACLARGKHVYCEAPIADTVEHAAEMCQAAKKSRGLLQIGFQRRSDPRYRLGFEHVIPEMLGEMRLIRAQWGQGLAPFVIYKKPPKTEILERHGYPNAEQYWNWRWFRKFGKGPAAMQMPHQVDLFSWAWGVRPVAVTAVGTDDLFTPRREVLDTLMCHYEFRMPDGTARWASHQFVSLSNEGGTRAEFVGSRASLVLGEGFDAKNCVRRAYHSGHRGFPDDFKVSWETFVQKGWIEPSQAEKSQKSVPGCPNEFSVYDCLNSVVWGEGSWDCPLAVKSTESRFQAHLRNFFAAIRGEEKLNCPPEVAYAATVAVHGAIRSAERRETVRFRPEDFLVPEGNA